jgi:D-serine/D-alanine/glycine transporter
MNREHKETHALMGDGDLLGHHHMEQEPQLDRALSNRHIQLIAIGGAIGTGLFMGSGQTIASSGTSVLLTYMIVGFFFFLSCVPWENCYSPTPAINRLWILLRRI